MGRIFKVVCTVLDSMASYCPVGIIDCTIAPLWQVSGQCTLQTKRCHRSTSSTNTPRLFLDPDTGAHLISSPSELASSPAFCQVRTGI
jgi:hypothetical protein